MAYNLEILELNWSILLTPALETGWHKVSQRQVQTPHQNTSGNHQWQPKEPSAVQIAEQKVDISSAVQ